MKRTRIHLFQKEIDSNYSAHKGYIPIPINVRNIKTICPVLHNAEGYISLLKELDEEQVLNEMRLEDDKMHLNSKKVAVDVTPDNADLKFILRLTKVLPQLWGRKEVRTTETTTVNGEETTVEHVEYKDVYETKCTLKVIIEYEEDV
jgi:hypothetical protein